MMKPFTILFVTVVGVGFLVLLATWGTHGALQSLVEAPIEEVDSPPGAYFRVAWLPTNEFITSYERITFSHELTTVRYTYQLWKVPVGGGDATLIELPDDPDRCFRVERRVQQILSGGSVIVMITCRSRPSDAAVTYLEVYDPASGYSMFLMDEQRPKAFSTASFAPDLQRGIVTTASGIADKMYWLDVNGHREVDVGMVRANFAVWSPLDDHIVFWGDRRLKGPVGPGWAAQPTNLWAMPAECAVLSGSCEDRLELLVQDVESPVGPAWSPDGQWIGFYGIIKGTEALWLLQMNTEKLVGISTRGSSYLSLSWSPDGQQIVVVARLPDTDLYDSTSLIYILDISQIVKQ